MPLSQLITQATERLTDSGVSFGHGTINAYEEATWLVLWRLCLPLGAAIEANFKRLGPCQII